MAARLARQRPYIPEPGFARMAKLWAQITGALPDDETGSTDAGPDDAGGLDLGLDLADDADETAAVTAKIAAARELAAQDPELPDDPAGNGGARRRDARRAAPPVPDAVRRHRHPA